MSAPDLNARLQAFLHDLYHRTGRGIVPGLEATTDLLARLGNPHHSLKAVHVAGTNGKGSVCAMVESVLRAAGYRTGLYTSPHLRRFNERIRVDNEEIPDAALEALCREVDRHAEAVRKTPGLRSPTFFEFTTALAFAHFAREAVDVCVVETGMGGRWDSTNVLTPLLSVVTPIAIDHERFLGETIPEIAAEKAGILKPGVPAVIGGLNEEAATVLQATARAVGCPLTDAADLVSVQALGADWDGQRIRIETASARHRPLRLPLLGAHQITNSAIAVAACEVLRDTCGLALSDAALRSGLASVRWPGRLQVLRREPVVLLDCAHNPAGARALCKAVAALAGGDPLGWIVGCSHDKDLAGIFRAWAPVMRQCWVVPLSVERGASPAELAAVAAAAGVEAGKGELAAAWSEALDWARREGGVVVVAGSIYLAGEVLEWLGV